MRYIPQSRYSFEEICEQCKNAINRIPTISTPDDDSFYDELLQFASYRELIGVSDVRPMKDYGSLVK